MTNEMIDKLNSITDEFEKAIDVKCTELNYDKNKGIITLEESFINLNSIKEALLSAISSEKLAQFPITFQKEIIGSLSNIIKYGSEITSGTDSVVNLVNSIESLNAILWQFGFYKISTEEIELTKRLNKIKYLEVELSKKREIIDSILNKKGDIDKIQEEIITERAENQKLSEAISANLESSKKIIEQLTDSGKQAKTIVEAIEEVQKKSDSELTASTESKKSITTIKDDIEVFFGKVSAFQEKIDEVSTRATSTVDENNLEAKKLATELTRLEGLIKDQIEKATGFSLFHSFQTRKAEIVKSKIFWAWTLAALVAASVTLSLIIGFTSSSIDMWFYIKLSFTLPIIYAIAFVNTQYSRERKLEEDYAFKSNISISLVPYKELIEKTIDIKEPESRKKYNDFLIQTIDNVFTPPTEKATSKIDDDPSKILDNLGKAIETIVKPLQPLLKLLK